MPHSTDLDECAFEIEGDVVPEDIGNVALIGTVQINAVFEYLDTFTYGVWILFEKP